MEERKRRLKPLRDSYKKCCGKKSCTDNVETNGRSEGKDTDEVGLFNLKSCQANKQKCNSAFFSQKKKLQEMMNISS